MKVPVILIQSCIIQFDIVLIFILCQNCKMYAQYQFNETQSPNLGNKLNIRLTGNIKYFFTPIGE